MLLPPPLGGVPVADLQSCTEQLQDMRPVIVNVTVLELNENRAK